MTRLYHDQDVRNANPFLAGLLPIFKEATARPSRAAGPQYNRVSAAFWMAVHDTLAGQGSAAANLTGLEARLERLTRRR
jgi:trehalose/maltose transport system substrate-binding protein